MWLAARFCAGCAERATRMSPLPNTPSGAEDRSGAKAVFMFRKHLVKFPVCPNLIHPLKVGVSFC